MVVGVVLWKLKGLVCTPVFVEVGDEGACVVTVVASAAEDEPSAVATPTVVAFHVVGVDFVEGSYAIVLQVHKVKVGILMPDVEHAVGGKGEQEPAPVGRDARIGGTHT